MVRFKIEIERITWTTKNLIFFFSHRILCTCELHTNLYYTSMVDVLFLILWFPTYISFNTRMLFSYWQFYFGWIIETKVKIFVYIVCTRRRCVCIVTVRRYKPKSNEFIRISCRNFFFLVSTCWATEIIYKIKLRVIDTINSIENEERKTRLRLRKKWFIHLSTCTQKSSRNKMLRVWR